MTRAERGAREFLSAWQTWMVIAFFGLAAVAVYSINLSGKQAREEAARLAATKAAAGTQVGQCFVSVKNAPIVRGFIRSHEAIIENGILANRTALELSPPNAPLRSVRLKSLVRLENAKDNADKLRRLIVSTTPTRAKCVRLAHQLGIDASRYTNQKEKP